MAQAPTTEDIACAEALLAAGQTTAAVSMLERMAFIDPEAGRVWELLTRALLQAGEYERAAITSYAFEALAPSPRAYLFRSQALLHVEPHEALTPALAAQAATPQDWEAQVQVCRAHLVGRDVTRAGLQSARRAVELAPELAEPHAVLALALRRHELFAEAEVSAARALSIDHTNSEARDLLDGLALMRPRREAASAAPRTGGSRVLMAVLIVLVVVLLIAAPVVLFVVGSRTAYVSALVLAALTTLLALLMRQRTTPR